MEFLDRIEELDRIATFFREPEGGLACLYGRRRIGKSRLLAEALKGRTDVMLHIADRSESSLQRARLAKDMGKICPGFETVVYPDWGALLDHWRQNAPRGSVLVIDEFPYLVEKAPELPSVVQRVLEGIDSTGLKLVLCGSSQRMMQGLVLKDSEPLYGRARELIKLSSLKIEWMKVAFPEFSHLSILEHYGIWGGVPRYWELSVNERSLWDTLRRQVYSPHGLLRTEPNYLLMDDLGDSVQASSILTLIGMGSERMSEIAGRLQVPVTALTRPLKRLVDLGLVRKEVPFGADAKGNKRSLYKVDDPFLAFWYRFVLPNFSDEQYLDDPREQKELKIAYHAYLGEVWERVVRETLGRRPLPGCTGRFRHAARWWGTGTNQRPMEVDVVAESVDRRTLLVGEAKLKLSDREAEHELAELKKKATLLPFSSEYEEVICRLFVAESGRLDEPGMSWVLGDD